MPYAGPPIESKFLQIFSGSHFLKNRLQERARDKARGLKGKQEWIESSIANLSDAESEIARAELLLKENEEQFSEACKLLTESETSVSELQQKIAGLGILSEKCDAADRQMAALTADLAELEQREKQLSQRHQSLFDLTKRSPEIEAMAREFEILKSSLEEMDRKSLLAQEVSARRMELQTELARLRSKLELEVEHAESLFTEAEERRRKLEKETGDSEKIEQAHLRFKEISCKKLNLLAARKRSFTSASALMNCTRLWPKHASNSKRRRCRRKRLLLNLMLFSKRKSCLKNKDKLCRANQKFWKDSRRI